MRLSFSCLAFIIIVTGCTPILDHTAPSVAGKPAEKVSFCGIERTLKQNKEARVLIIHGMGWHESQDYDADFRGSLTLALQMDPLGCAGPYPVVNPDDPINVYGGVLRCTFRRRSDGARLRIYNLLWSPLTMPYKVAELGYDWDSAQHGRRTRVNRALKKELINRSVSDAVLYSGELRDVMRYSVRQAICASVTDQVELNKECGAGRSPTNPDTRLPSPGQEGTNGPPDLFVVTHSLGSAMLIETLGEMKLHHEAAGAAASLVQHVQLIAMMANQLPLIRLARLKTPPQDAALQPSTETGEFAELFGSRQTPITVAAFSDANDLLSYPIPETWQEVLYPEISNRLRFINYPVTNVKHAAFGMFADPSKAHTGYWENPDVIKTIAFGHDCP